MKIFAQRRARGSVVVSDRCRVARIGRAITFVRVHFERTVRCAVARHKYVIGRAVVGAHRRHRRDTRPRFRYCFSNMILLHVRSNNNILPASVGDFNAAHSKYKAPRINKHYKIIPGRYARSDTHGPQKSSYNNNNTEI